MMLESMEMKPLHAAIGTTDSSKHVEQGHTPPQYGSLLHTPSAKLDGVLMANITSINIITAVVCITSV